MQLISLQEAAQSMAVPAAWVLGMIDLGQLEMAAFPDGTMAIDRQDIAVRGWDVGNQQSVPSYYHCIEMMEKIIAH